MPCMTALRPEASINDPPAITDPDSPNNAINGRYVKSTDQFHLPIPDRHQTRIHSICLAECGQREDRSRIVIGLEPWLSRIGRVT